MGSDPVGRGPDSFVPKINFSLTAMMRHMYIQGEQHFSPGGDMEPAEKKLEDALKEAYGDSGPQVLDQLRHSCQRIVTEISVYRADLSYIPK
jgi:hypothetical protein